MVEGLDLRATYGPVAFRFVAADARPDQDAIEAFRQRFPPQIEALFVQVLGVPREMGVRRKLGAAALDGTKIHANANRHEAGNAEPRWPNARKGCQCSTA